MSFSSTVSTFFHSFKAVFGKLFGNKSASYVQVATATITYIAPLVETIVAFEDPAAAVVITPLIAKVQSALAAANTVIKAAGPAPTVKTYLDSIVKNLGLVLSAAQVKDPATLAKLTAVVNTITAEVNALIAELSSMPATA